MDRRIKATRKDKNGNIVALCNPGESWSPRSVKEVFDEIKNAKRSYYVQELPKRSYLHAVSGGALKTTDDHSSSNHLDNLPAS